MVGVSYAGEAGSEKGSRARALDTVQNPGHWYCTVIVLKVQSIHLHFIKVHSLHPNWNVQIVSIPGEVLIEPAAGLAAFHLFPTLASIPIIL